MLRISGLLFSALAVAPSLVAAIPQVVAAQGLTVRRVDGSERVLAVSELAALPRSSFETLDHGKPARFEGVDLRGILRLASAGPADSLRGPLLRRVVLLVGADGYAAAVALAELDDGYAARRVYVVNRANGEPLSADLGPLRAVVAGDGRAGRWVRQLVRVEVVELSVAGATR